MWLTGRLIRVADVTAVERDEMFSLMARFYDNVDRKSFEIDLQEKDWVILLRDPVERVVRGFSTQMLLRLTVGGRPVRALFSGDTIVHRDYWGQHPLSSIWGKFVISLIYEHDDDPLFWFLTTKGYKTYRFLPIFFREFYPRHDAVTPDWARDLIDSLAAHKYPDAYEMGSGMLSWGDRGCCLADGVAQITDRRFHDPHIRFFAQENPGHAHGDELCCVAHLTRANFTSSAYRVIGSMPSIASVT